MIDLLDTLWVLIASFLVFIMHLGFATVEAGFTRAKNTVAIIMKNLMALLVGSFAFVVIGFTLAFSGTGPIIGNLDYILLSGLDNSVWAGLTISALVFFFFQMMFAATSATVVSGAVAERIKFAAFLAITLVLIAFVYPIIAHWIWGGGWLAELGFIDFAGSTVVHSVGGWAGLATVLILGPRVGKYIKGKAQTISGHNIGLGCVGLFMLWFGWFGFNGGSELAMDNNVALIIVNTFLAALAAGLVTMLITWKKGGKPDTSMTMNGILAGLVAITAPCAVVSPHWAMVIGAIAGAIVVYAVDFFEIKLKVDDPVGAISVHGINGLWGTLAVGIFASTNGVNGLITGSGSQLAIQALGAACTFLLVFPTMLILAMIIKKTIGIRVSKEFEMTGLDTAEFGGAGYPDFVRKKEDMHKYDS